MAISNRLDSEVQTLKFQATESQLEIEGLAKAKETTERQLKSAGHQIAELTARCEDQQNQVSYANEAKLKLTTENSELEARLLILEEKCAASEANYDKALAEIEMHKLQHEIDTKSLASSAEQAKRLSLELNMAKERCEEEKTTNAELQTQLNKVRFFISFRVSSPFFALLQ